MAEIKGDEQPVVASKLESAYAPEEDTAQQAAGDWQGSYGVGGDESFFHDLGKHISNSLKDFVGKGDMIPPEPTNQPDQPLPMPKGGPYSLSIPPERAPAAAPNAQAMVTSAPQPTEQPPQGDPALAAANNLGNVAQDVGNKVQDTYKQGLDAQQKLMSDMQTHFNNNMAQDQQLANAYASKQLDPNRVINSMDTGDKVMTTLGLMLSGIGSGITGQKNLALEMLNNHIARDLEAQKTDITKASELYRMHHQMTGDTMMADMAYMKDNMIAMDAAIGQQQARLQGPQAQLNAQQTRLALQGQILDLNQKQAMWQATQEAMRGAGQPSNSNDIINNNRWNQLKLTGILKGNDETAATKEATNYKEAEALRNDMEDSAQHLDKKLFAGALTPSDRASAINAFAGRIAKIGEGRFNLEEAKLQAQALLPSPLDMKSTVDNKTQRRKAFFDSLAATPTLDRLQLKNTSAQAMKQTNLQDGQTAVNPKTGARIILKGGKWQNL